MTENMKITEPTWLEVDLDRLEHNIACLRVQVPDDVGMIAVVKAQGYGTGSEMVARTALSAGVIMLAVARTAEALYLRNQGITAPILNFGYMTEQEQYQSIQHDIIATVPDIATAQQLDQAAAKMQMQARVHLNIDTGMGRVGFLPAEFDECWEQIKALKHVVVEGVYTHFPSADEAETLFTEQQIETFCRLSDRIQAQLPHPVLAHMCNSAAIVKTVSCYHALVRPGICLYGAYGSKELPDMGLQLIASLKTRVAHLKRVAAGTAISYGRTHITNSETTIATLPIGYADGVSRLLSNAGEVLIQGRRYPIVGRVTMDQVMVDLGDAADINVGDIATVMGHDGKQCITADEIAEKTQTIAYEVLTSISARVPRVYIQKGNIIKVMRNGLI